MDYKIRLSNVIRIFAKLKRNIEILFHVSSLQVRDPSVQDLRGQFQDPSPG